MSVTMAEIDLLRARLDHHVELRRVYEADKDEAEAKLLRLVRHDGATVDDVDRAEYACAKSYQRWRREVEATEQGEVEVLVALAAYHARPQVVRYVLFHPEAGVYIGNAMGLGFWSLWDPAGQEVAVTFASVAEAMEHVASWEAQEPVEIDPFRRAITAREVLCGTVEGSTVPHYATIAECFRAGLPRWDPDARPEGT